MPSKGCLVRHLQTLDHSANLKRTSVEQSHLFPNSRGLKPDPDQDISLFGNRPVCLRACSKHHWYAVSAWYIVSRSALPQSLNEA